jgi:uncharacterized protein (TIGR00162 family)
MKESAIKIVKRAELNKPILIVGLPGIGNVGKLVAETLKKQFKFEKIAVLYSPHFPHQVVMLKSGGIRLVGNRFYVLKGKKGAATNDIILLTGETQAITPEGQYEVNQKIVDFFADQLKGTFIYTLGGYSVLQKPAVVPKVYANVTNKEIIPKFKDSGVVFGKSRGMIWGSAGLILAYAKMRKLPGICLMGETSALDIDAAAAKSVLLVLAKQLKLEVNTTELDKIVEHTAKIIKQVESQMQGTPPGLDQKPSYIR